MRRDHGYSAEKHIIVVHEHQQLFVFVCEKCCRLKWKNNLHKKLKRIFMLIYSIDARSVYWVWVLTWVRGLWSEKTKRNGLSVLTSLVTDSDSVSLQTSRNSTLMMPVSSWSAWPPKRNTWYVAWKIAHRSMGFVCIYLEHTFSWMMWFHWRRKKRKSVCDYQWIYSFKFDTLHTLGVSE